VPRKSQKPLFGLSLRDMEHVGATATRDLEALRGQKVFITGGTGFFGKWLLAALCHADTTMNLGLQVRVLSRDPGRFLQLHPEVAEWRELRFHTGDITDFEMTKDRYDYVIHAATDTLGIATPEQEEKRAQGIVGGTTRVIELTRHCGARRLLNVSSGAVYGTAAAKPSGASEEDYATAQPVTPYARAKREAEALCGASGLDFVTARAFAFLGPHLPLDAHYAAGNFLRDARQGGPIVVRGDGTALRSYLYPADLVIWLLALLMRGHRGEAYNVGSDETVTTAELARKIAEAVQPPLEVVIQSSMPEGPQNIYLPDLGKTRSSWIGELTLNVSVPLEKAIGRTLAFLRREA
jgi:nucleoside-diphosphate-sugar epimerase